MVPVIVNKLCNVIFHFEKIYLILGHCLIATGGESDIYLIIKLTKVWPGLFINHSYQDTKSLRIYKLGLTQCLNLDKTPLIKDDIV